MPIPWARWADISKTRRRINPLLAGIVTGILTGLLSGSLFATSPGTDVEGSRVSSAREPSNEELLASARQTARLRLQPGGSTLRNPFETLIAKGGLWRVRAQFARIEAQLVISAASSARQELAQVESSTPPFPELKQWLGLRADLLEMPGDIPGQVSRLLAFAGATPSEPLARSALRAASRLASQDGTRRQLLGAWDIWRQRAPATPRATMAYALGLAHLAESAEANERLQKLALQFPDAPERDADLFDEEELRLFDRALQLAPAKLRIARARALVARKPDEALALLANLPLTDENRIASAEIHLEASRNGEALALLEKPDRIRSADPAEQRHLAVVQTIAELRLEGSKERGGRNERATGRRNRSRVRRGSRRPLPLRGSASPPAVVSSSELERLTRTVEQLIGTELREGDRRRLLADGLRFELRHGDHDEARGFLAELQKIDPMTSAGAEEFFAEAFTFYQQAKAGGPGAAAALLRAARLWDEQNALYRDPSVRRRTSYWSAKAHAAAGDNATARSLYASLLAGSSPDLYARWASQALGVPLSPPPPPLDSEMESSGSLSSESALPSREFLACGLPVTAEDAAEAEASLDPLFAALLASERGDHRRAASLLKSRFPALGTPEEGAVPAPIRRAYYPLRHAALLALAAARNGISPNLLFGLIRQESLFQPQIRSHAGAVGLMQVMPATGRFLTRQEHRKGLVDLTDPFENVALGSRYLAQLLSRFSGDAGAALAAYNAGPGRVERWKREGRHLSPDEFIEAIPLSEPRDYVKRVLFFEGAYASLYVPTDPERSQVFRGSVSPAR